MRIPATEDANRLLMRELPTWKRGDRIPKALRVRGDVPHYLHLPPHAATLFFALKETDLSRKAALARRHGDFLCYDKAQIEELLRFHWKIDSIDQVWPYLIKNVVRPVFKRFRHGVLDRSENECVERLLLEIIPDTRPTTWTWLPDPRRQLLASWRTALWRDLDDEAKRIRRLEACLAVAARAEQAFEIRESIECGALAGMMLDLRDATDREGVDWTYIDPDATADSLRLPNSTFYYRRDREWRRLVSRIPALAALRPKRRTKLRQPLE